MHLFKSVFIVLTICIFISQAQARPLSEGEKLSDLDQAVALIKSGYGPLQYKKTQLGIDVDALRATYAERIRNSKTNAEFYRLLQKFIAEFKDTHFSTGLPTNHVSSLPFSTDLFEGKVLIEDIDRQKLSEKDFPFAVGDEIIEMNGQPIAEVVHELAKYRGHGFRLSELRTGAMLVSHRPAASVPAPQGEVTLKIRRGMTDIIEEVTLKWQESGEPLDERVLPAANETLAWNDLTLREQYLTNYDEISTEDFWQAISRTDLGRAFRCSGKTRTAIPKDATIIMMEPFVAYYHPTPKGNVGYLRIPHYSPKGANGQAEFDLRFAQYEYAVSILEKNTVGLIIDQDHNCGGSVTYLERMLGLFLGKAYQPMQFQLLASKQEYLDFKEWVDGTDKHTLEYLDIKATLDLVHKAWMSGAFMTEKTSITGKKLLEPNHIRYTKPILMLVDEMSGSGGDAFPSMMQGYGRAKLMGTRTMGAGGHVVQQAPLFYSQVKLRMTKSLFYRPDGVAVENNGAVPDYKYSPTRDDLLYEYKSYQRVYLEKLLEML